LTAREMIVVAAEGWLRTPYHHAARVRGAGVDCINLLAAVYEEAGLVQHIDLPHYPPDWMLHRSEERFLMGLIETRLEQVQRPGMGDIALFRYGRCYSHGAIVISWPSLIHAFAGLGVVYGDARHHPLLDAKGAPRWVKFYSLMET
jgi:cell wall-associated NlpC family hydrolase